MEVDSVSLAEIKKMCGPCLSARGSLSHFSCKLEHISTEVQVARVEAGACTDATGLDGRKIRTEESEKGWLWRINPIPYPIYRRDSQHLKKKWRNIL